MTLATSSQGAAPSGSPALGTPAGAQFVLPPSGELLLDDDHDDAPLCFRMLADILESAPVTGEAGGEQAAGLLLAVDDEPTTFDVARGDEEWRKAMLEELSSIEQNDT